ncbi:Protein of unknown function; Putative transposase (fragment) [Bradyrhizobium sp. ORS 285]
MSKKKAERRPITPAVRNRPDRPTADATAAAMQNERSHQHRRRAMEFFCGLDVGMDQTAICVVDDKGEVLLEVAVMTDPDAIKGAVSPYLGRLRRVGHEAGALSPWLHRIAPSRPAGDLSGDAACARRAACPAQQDRPCGRARHCTHHADRLVLARAHQDRAVLSAAIAADASPQSQAQLLDLENAIRHSLKAFGIRLSRGGFAQAVRDAVVGDALISQLIDAMLNARAALWKEYCRLHGLVVKLVDGHELCRRFM